MSQTTSNKTQTVEVIKTITKVIKVIHIDQQSQGGSSNQSKINQQVKTKPPYKKISENKTGAKPLQQTSQKNKSETHGTNQNTNKPEFKPGQQKYKQNNQPKPFVKNPNAPKTESKPIQHNNQNSKPKPTKQNEQNTEVKPQNFKQPKPAKNKNFQEQNQGPTPNEPGKTWMYVGRMKAGTTESDVMSYLELKFSGHQFKVQKLPSWKDGKTQAFKVQIPDGILDEFKDVNNWHCDVKITKFVIFKK